MLIRKIPFGKIIISIISFMLAIGSWAADYNYTHVKNPLWPPHAKFHNGQTMFFGTFLGGLAIWFLWGRMWNLTAKQKLFTGSIFASLYWITQIGSYFIPGTRLIDPEFATGSWYHDNRQLPMAVVFTLLIPVCVYIELKRIEKIQAKTI